MDKIRIQVRQVIDLTDKVNNHYITSKYKNNFSGNGNEFIHTLRDGIIYRVDSLGWHLQQLELLHKKAESDLALYVKKDMEWDHLLRTLYIQHYLFDDIIFNLLSLFEYIANTVGFFWKHNHGKKMRWGRLLKTIRNKECDFPDEKLSIFIKQSHNKLVNNLEEYRAHIFHYQKRVGSVSRKIDFNLNKSSESIIITIPESFRKIFKSYRPNNNECELIELTRYSVSESLKVIIKILSYLLKWSVDPLPRKTCDE